MWRRDRKILFGKNRKGNRKTLGQARELSLESITPLHLKRDSETERLGKNIQIKQVFCVSKNVCI